MASYVFVTQWQFVAPVAKVWDEIYQSSRWPEWWPSVQSVTELRKGDKEGVGSIRRYVWRGALPYTLSFDMHTTVVKEYSRLEGIASGELSGRGCWTFSSADADASTHVRYDWEVDANKVWMRALAPILRPVFEWNHDYVMEKGRIGLHARLSPQP